METPVQDPKQLLTEIIQKLMVVVGAELALSKVKNIHGMTVSEDGTVTDIQTEPQALLQELVEEFVGLSGEIVKQITELLASKQMQQKMPVELPAAPIQPEKAPEMTLPTPEPMPTDQMPAAPAPTEQPATPAPTPEPTAPTTEPAQVQPEQPIPEQNASNPFPSTQPMNMPAATIEPIQVNQAPQPAPTEQPATPAPTPEPTAPTTEPTQMPAVPTGQPAPTAPTAPAGQNDPDMQHIINEALKQTK